MTVFIVGLVLGLVVGAGGVWYLVRRGYIKVHTD